MNKSFVYNLFFLLISAIVGMQILLNLYIQIYFARWSPSYAVWYFDGVIVDRMSFENSLNLQQVYFEGHPIKLIFDRPKSIWIDSIDFNFTNHTFNTLINIPEQQYVVKNIRFFTNYFNQKVIFNGVHKQYDPLFHRIYFDTADDNIDSSFVLDLKLSDCKIKTIDIVGQMNVNSLTIKIKRGEFWLSIINDNNVLNSSGEASAGFVEMNQDIFLDANLILNKNHAYFSARSGTSNISNELKVNSFFDLMTSLSALE